MEKVIIIGAGPAGLTAAYELSRFGKNSIILEASNKVGGLSRTDLYNGYRFDIGGHRFFSKISRINKIWQEILGEDLVERKRLSRIYYRDHFYDYPLKPLNAMKGLGVAESLKIGFDYARYKILPLKREENFEHWVTNRFGSRLFDTFFRTYTEKVWGIPCEEISADWAAQRIKNLSLRQAVYSALVNNGNSNKDKVITSLIEKFYYPKLGPGMMWERCHELLKNRGNITIFGNCVERIFHKNGRVHSLFAHDLSGNINEYNPDEVISSMPLKELIQALDPLPPDTILEASANLRYRDFLTVVLILDKDSVFPDNWIYIHAPEVKMGRIQNYKNWSPEMVQDQSKTALGLEYFLWETDDEWAWSDEQLIKFGIDECARLGIIVQEDVIDGSVIRAKKAYPVYDINYHYCVETIRDYFRTFQNLQTIGRNGLHRYNNQDHSMLTGIYAARNLLGENHDVWAVNTEDNFHEHVDRKMKVPKYEADTEIIKEKIVQTEIDELLSRLDPFALGCAVAIVSSLLVFFATAVLVLKGGKIIGPTLSLIGQFFPGYTVSWSGAIIGLIETGIFGFALGFFIAGLRNLAVSMFAKKVKHDQEKDDEQQLLDKL
jgi:protoporphyrinogen oxidase